MSVEIPSSDRRTQLNALLEAMLQVRSLVFGSPMFEPEAVDQDRDVDSDWDEG